MNSKAKNSPMFNNEKDLANYMLKNVSDSLKQAIKTTVSLMVKEEMEQIRKEVDEKLSFNGYYQRNLTSMIGKVSEINIPRFREKPMNQLELKSTNVFETEKENFFNLVAEMHRVGISQRKIKRLAKESFGITISNTRVGTVHRELAQREEFQINSQAISEEFEYLLIDGIWIKCKNFGRKENNKAVLLCALGITREGKRKIIGFKFSLAEDYDTWNEFLLSLKERGLTSKGLKVVVSDDGSGLSSVLAQLFPKVKHQICITHKMRNVIGKTSHKHKASVAEGLKEIYACRTREEAKKKADEFARRWYVKEEKAVRSFHRSFEKTLTYFDFPAEKWKQIRTNNILEREFREVRRRIKVFDNSFNDSQSCNRYGNSIFSYLNKYYPEHLHSKSVRVI